MNTFTALLAVLISAGAFLFCCYAAVFLCAKIFELRKWFREEAEGLWSTLQWQRDQKRNPTTNLPPSHKKLSVLQWLTKWAFLILFVLVWMAVELLVLLGTILFAIVVLALLRSAANDLRDWWHRGEYA